MSLIVLEAGMSKIKGSADSVSDEGTFPSVQTAVFSLSDHMVEDESSGLFIPYKSTNTTYENSTLKT